MRYHIIRTDLADAQIQKNILYIAERFSNHAALEKLNALEKSILALGDNPYMGTEPKYPVLKRQGYKTLVLEKDLVFYKVNEPKKEIIIYAVVDRRQDYVNIIRGL